MSRSLIVGIVCFAISSTFVSTCLAQEDAAEGSSETLSLSERLAALRDKFRRDDSGSTSQQKSATRSSRPTYESSQKQRSAGPSASKSSKHKSLLSAVSSSPLLPQGVFGRKETNNHRSTSNNDQHPQAYGPSTPVRVATKPRISSKTNLKTNKQQPARKSPPTARTNELEAALADLVPAEPARKTNESMADVSDSLESPVKTPVQTPVQTPVASVPAETYRPSTPVPSDSFDLHEALVGDNSSKAVAEDSKETTNSTPAIIINDKATVADEETFATSEPTPATTPKVDLSEQTFAKPSPVAVESRPAYAAPPITKSPTANQPGASKPIAQQQTRDPFEAAAAEVFSSDAVDNRTPGQSPLAAEKQNTAAKSYSPNEDLLQSFQQPVIVSHVEGPRRITVGHEATYRITLENTSNTKAKSLASAIRVPKWAEVVGALSTSGVVERISQEEDADVLEWKLSELAAQSSETLRLRLIPRSGRPLQLGVQWSQAPMTSETMVEVQEPKLQLEVSGPQEVLFGKPQRYRLTLSNPGTGRAEQVAIQLIPPGGNIKTATKQKIGALKPGEVREIDLELTAREAGELTIQASATADDGLKAESVKKILCRKPELVVDWRGPETKYAGTIAAYYFRIRNPGTASTEPVTVRVKLPAGSQFVAASEGHLHNAKTNAVSWKLPSIAAGQEQFMQVRCKVEQPGANSFDITAKTASGDLSDTKAIQTNVVALADLKLEVSDPQGPIPLGESVLYEIRIRNRGATAAEGISVTGLFSAGIDPTSVEGAQYTIRDGRVTFHPIQNLPAGREAVLRIRATANQAGNHVFRAEVACQDLEIKLAAEETTRFFEDEFRWEDGKTPYTAERNESATR